MARIQVIEKNANHFTSPVSSPKNQFFSYNESMKKSNSLVDTHSRLKIYSIDELSELIVNLEKAQADIKEKLSQTNRFDKERLRSEITVNENKLGEIRDLQMKLLRVGKRNN